VTSMDMHGRLRLAVRERMESRQSVVIIREKICSRERRKKPEMQFLSPSRRARLEWMSRSELQSRSLARTITVNYSCMTFGFSRRNIRANTNTNTLERIRQQK
jgi:hypothetical protein